MSTPDDDGQDDLIYTSMDSDSTSGYGIHCDRCGQRITSGEPIVEWTRINVIVHEDCPPVQDDSPTSYPDGTRRKYVTGDLDAEK